MQRYGPSQTVDADDQHQGETGAHSAELRDVLDRFFDLSKRDQLQGYALIREHLSAEAWIEDEEEAAIMRAADSLAALEHVAEELREGGELEYGRAPTAKQFDRVAVRLGLEWRSGRVIRIFGSWRNAKQVLLGGKPRESPAQKRKRERAVRRTRDYEDPLRAVRLWLASVPAGKAMADYDAFAKEENRRRQAVEERPMPSGDAVSSGLRLGWSDVLSIANGEASLLQAQKRRQDDLLAGITDESLVGAEVVALVLSLRPQHIDRKMTERGFPRPVARVGRNRAWLLGDVKAYRDGKSVPKREELSFQKKVIGAVELSADLGISIDYLRTLLSEEAWSRIPRPDGRVGRNHYWWREGMEVGE